MRGKIAVTLLAAALVAGPTARSSQIPSDIIGCAPEHPVVWIGKGEISAVGLSLWPAADGPDGHWKASGGEVRRVGDRWVWDLSGAVPARYTASWISQPDGAEARTCQVIVFTRDAADRRASRELARSYLVGEREEESGYGAYSYLLFGSRPDEASRARHRSAIAAYLELISDVKAVERFFKPEQVNVTYVPLQTAPPNDDSDEPEWLLSNYGYERARAILSKLPGDHLAGPYLVSYREPLTWHRPVESEYLILDLSRSTPDLASRWVKLFMNVGAQQHYWEVPAWRRLVLRLGEAVEIFGEGLVQVRSSWADLGPNLELQE